MNLLWLRNNGLALLLLTVLLASSVWAYETYQLQPAEVPVEDNYIIVRPNYEILARKSVSVWREGIPLEQGRAAYFYAAAPLVNVTPTLEITGVKQGLLQGTLRSSVIVRAVNEIGDVFWDYQLNVGPVESFNFSNGGVQQTDSMKFAGGVHRLDIQEAYEEILRINEELSFKRAIFQLVYKIDINLSGSIDQSKFKKSITNILPVTMAEESFAIPTTEKATLSEILDKPEKPVSQEPQIGEKIAKNPLPIFAVVVLLLLLFFSILKNIRGKRTEKKEAIEHRRFKEWITEGCIQIKDRVCINVYSLEGLVDLAIDLDKRIIYDPEKLNYCVLEENLVYIYDRERIKAILKSDKQKLGKLLLELGFLRPEQLEIGLLYQQRVGSLFGESLMALGFIDEITLYSTLAAQANMSFIEFNPEAIKIDPQLLQNLTINQARVLEAVPMGERKDGKLVMVCSNPFKEGVQKALRELFDRDIVVFGARPTVIIQLINQFERAEKRQLTDSLEEDEEGVNKSQILSPEERSRFVAGYYNGIVSLDLFIKASGLVGETVISRVPASALFLQWLVNNNYLDEETACLVTGIRKAIEVIDAQLRQENKLPNLWDILEKTNYLTATDVNWAVQEAVRQSVSVDKILIESFLASPGTIRKVQFLLGVLYKILTNRPYFFRASHESR